MNETKKALIAGEYYDLTENEDGSKQLTIEKNKAGFKININVSGCKQEHEEGIKAVRDFYVKGSLGFL